VLAHSTLLEIAIRRDQRSAAAPVAAVGAALVEPDRPFVEPMGFSPNARS
jgi:hypothetical protein